MKVQGLIETHYKRYIKKGTNEESKMGEVAIMKKNRNLSVTQLFICYLITLV